MIIDLARRGSGCRDCCTTGSSVSLGACRTTSSLPSGSNPEFGFYSSCRCGWHYATSQTSAGIRNNTSGVRQHCLLSSAIKSSATRPADGPDVPSSNRPWPYTCTTTAGATERRTTWESGTTFKREYSSRSLYRRHTSSERRPCTGSKSKSWSATTGSSISGCLHAWRQCRVITHISATRHSAPPYSLLSGSETTASARPETITHRP
jgi:hypothetical protein